MSDALISNLLSFVKLKVAFFDWRRDRCWSCRWGVILFRKGSTNGAKLLIVSTQNWFHSMALHLFPIYNSSMYLWKAKVFIFRLNFSRDLLIIACSFACYCCCCLCMYVIKIIFVFMNYSQGHCHQLNNLHTHALIPISRKQEKNANLCGRENSSNLFVLNR